MASSVDGIDVHAVAGAEDIGEQQADHERDRGHHLEIDQRLDADPADLLEVAGAGDAVHHDAEHDRRHDHRDQLEEGVAEDLQADGEVGNGHPEHDAEHQRGQNLNEKRGIDRLSRRRRSSGDGRSHGTLPPFDPNWLSNKRASLSRGGRPREGPKSQDLQDRRGATPGLQGKDGSVADFARRAISNTDLPVALICRVSEKKN